MTQDQHGQGQGTGSAVRGEVIRDDQAEESPAQAMTSFQKVASALRGDKPDEEEASTAPDENGTAAPPPENGTAAPPEGTARSDYWDDEASPVAVTRPDGLGPDAAEPRGGPGAAAGAAGAGTATGDHSETQPDIFGTTARPDPGEAPAAPEAVTPEAPAA